MRHLLHEQPKFLFYNLGVTDFQEDEFLLELWYPLSKIGQQSKIVYILQKERYHLLLCQYLYFKIF